MKVRRVIEYDGAPEDLLPHLERTLISMAGPIVRIPTLWSCPGEEPKPPKITMRLLEEKEV